MSQALYTKRGASGRPASCFDRSAGALHPPRFFNSLTASGWFLSAAFFSQTMPESSLFGIRIDTGQAHGSVGDARRLTFRVPLFTNAVDQVTARSVRE